MSAPSKATMIKQPQEQEMCQAVNIVLGLGGLWCLLTLLTVFRCLSLLVLSL